MDLCSLLRSNFGTSLSIHNMYGCTETPCIQWTYGGEISNQKLAPAGRPQPGVEVQILDDEIYIGGCYLAHGYFGDPDLTKSRFIQNPNGEGLLYRTGDLGHWVQGSNGVDLMVEGRADRQLNINGIRVAPEE